MGKIMKTSALVVGILLVVVGSIGIGFYVAGVIEILVERPADRSWLFWGLGFFAFGLIFAGAGVGLILVSRNSSRAERES